jgi:hypothetical protein
LAGAPGRGNYVCPFTFIGNNLEKTAFVVWKPNIYSEPIGVKEYVEAKACPFLIHSYASDCLIGICSNCSAVS